MIEYPGKQSFSSALTLGMLLEHQMRQDPHFYLFSPDETTSNKLQQVYQTNARAWAMPIKAWDLPEDPNGRIIEMLSENVLFATMVGHLMNGEQAIMASYEAFFNIIGSQLIQHIKFLQQADDVKWRTKIPAANLLSTSTCWRQDHNGFTHQTPALISTLLSLPSRKVNCLFPVDDMAAVAAFHYMISSSNVVNLTTFNKTEEPRWLTEQQSKTQLKNGGISTFSFTSDLKPDIIFTAAGDIASREAIYAIKILREDLPEAKIRFVNICTLSYKAIGTVDNPLSQTEFDKQFTKDKLILGNFHGYSDTLANILTEYADKKRVRVHGFSDHGTTTTPFEMLSLNQASRYHLAMDVANQYNRTDLLIKYRDIIKQNRAHAHKFGTDLPLITDFHL
ncbi:hypothetical protein IKF33_01285 [Candidatus Saccharibacteria bacterium]|nr:hypothetical protein [Candidatus Saccharibacteria bacterium]